mmetsp:Transcript_50318/g.96106  ORF Transcript_50318/g.96106 Transcript_50318/m.96106 type:complete len:342 (-) Transcript_50318:313-1338(-)
MARGLAWLRGSVRVAPAVRFFLLLSKELLAQLVVLPLPQVIRVGAKLALHLGVGVVGRRGSTSRRRPALSRGSTMSLTTRGSLLSLRSRARASVGLAPGGGNVCAALEVKRAALVRVAQVLVRLHHRLEGRLRHRARVLIRVEQETELAVCLLHRIQGGLRPHAQHSVPVHEAGAGVVQMCRGVHLHGALHLCPALHAGVQALGLAEHALRPDAVALFKERCRRVQGPLRLLLLQARRRPRLRCLCARALRWRALGHAPFGFAEGCAAPRPRPWPLRGGAPSGSGAVGEGLCARATCTFLGSGGGCCVFGGLRGRSSIMRRRCGWRRCLGLVRGLLGVDRF